MKKLLYLFVLLLFNFTLKAQFPITQNIGNDSTLLRIGQTSKGAIRGSLIPSTYLDTATANAGRIDDYPFAIIATSSDGNTWMRNYLATGWILLSGGTSPSGNFWSKNGDLFPVLPTPYPTIGTLAPWGGGFGIMTNSVVRAAVPDGGFTLSNDTSATKVFTWNPTTKDWGYANWNNGGATPTWQQTLTAGSTLPQDNTITHTGFGLKYEGGTTGYYWLSNQKYILLAADDNSGNSYQAKLDPTAGMTYWTYNNNTTSEVGFVTLQSSVSDANPELTIFGKSGGAPSFTKGADMGTMVRVRPDSLLLAANATGPGKLFIKNIQAGASTDSVLTWTASTGRVSYRNASALSVGSVPISGLTAATAANTINSGAHQQEWQWNTLANGYGLLLSSNSVNATSSTQNLFSAQLTGANATAAQETFAGSFLNGHTGTSGTNIGVYSYATSGTTNIAARFIADGGTNNYAIIIPSSSGSVGIGTVTPTELLHVNGATQMGTAGSTLGQLKISGNTSGTVTIQPAAAAGTYTLTLPTNDGDASQFLQTNGSGVLSWAAGASISPGEQGQIYQTSNGAAAWKYDTTTLVTLTAGARFQADTALFTDSTLYGSFYLDGNDTLIVTGLKAVMNGGTSDTLGIQVTYNDTINVIGTSMFTATLPINSTTVGTSPDADDWTGGAAPFKIPPGNWVWLKTPTVVAGRKPYYLSVSIIGYKKRLN